MIEIELKYQVEMFPTIDPSFVHHSEEHIVDTYYDNSSFDLIHRGTFIRRRGAYIDIKYMINENENSVCNEFNFLESQFHADSRELCELLASLDFEVTADMHSFSDFLTGNQLKELLVIDKQRVEFKNDHLTICFDTVKDLGKFIEFEATYEMQTDIASAKLELEKALKKYVDFRGSYHQEKTGYVELYLKKFNQAAYLRCMFQG